MTITRADLIRAAQVNDSIAQEHDHIGPGGAQRVASDLDIEVDGLVTIGAEYAGVRTNEVPPEHRGQVVETVAMAYTLGGLTALRAERLRDAA